MQKNDASNEKIAINLLSGQAHPLRRNSNHSPCFAQKQALSRPLAGVGIKRGWLDSR